MKHKSDAEAARRHRHLQAERMIEMFKQAHHGRRPVSLAELADWLDSEKAAGWGQTSVETFSAHQKGLAQTSRRDLRQTVRLHSGPAARRRAGYCGEGVLWQRARDLELKLR